MPEISKGHSPSALFQEPGAKSRVMSARSVDLSLGKGADLFLDFSGSESRSLVRAPFVGCIDDEYLIIKTPKSDGTLLSFDETERLVVRYLYDGKAYGFYSSAVKSIHSPSRLTFLKYPDYFELLCLRRAERIPLVMGVQRIGARNIKAEWIINISAAGCLLRLSEEVDPENKLYISFTLPNGVRIEKAPCRVVRNDSQNGYWLVGAEFISPEQGLNEVADYVNTVQSFQTGV